MRKYRVDRMQRHRPRVNKRQRLLLAACLLVLSVSLFMLGRYFVDYLRSRRVSQELQTLYHAETEAPLPTAAETPPPRPFTTPEPSGAPTVPPVTQIPVSGKSSSGYPDNPSLAVRDRFTALRRRNSDIIGWLSIGGLLDEAVVQRDNSYYLRRDYLGYHNDNGALFLDEICDLSTRPDMYIIYGHNMKTGAMFGALRNYENAAFLHANPFVTFETLYEPGRYVVFSVCNLHVDTIVSGVYAGQKAEMLNALISRSLFSVTVDVNTDDQLLLLVTCNGDDTERRIVAARRVRDGESEDGLTRVVSNTRKK